MLDMSQTYLLFLMLHTCLCTICFVFYYTSWRFYAFSGTNLLTRCHNVSSLFSAVFVFQKSYTENILGIGRNKTEVPIFPNTRRSPKQRRRGARGQPHHRVARPSPWPRHQVVGPPGPPPSAALPPIYSPRRENLYFVYFLWRGIVRLKRSRPTLCDLVRETGSALDVWLVPHMRLVDTSFSRYSYHGIYNGCWQP
jgi:hypothetical protein